MNNIYRPNEGLDAVRIRAEIETANRSETKRPTWAPAVVLDGGLLELCRELEFLSPDDKPVARLWAVFADPTRRGSVIRTEFSKHPLRGVRCRGFEMRAGEKHNGQQMTNAMMDHDGSWNIGHVLWGHTDIVATLAWAGHLQRHIETFQRALQPQDAPTSIERGDEPEWVKRRNAESVAKWKAGEQKKKDPAYIELIHAREQVLLNKLEKAQRKISKEETYPDWRFKAATRMTELATQRMLQFVGDPVSERRRGSQITGRCCCCGKTLTDKISVERGIGPECIKHIATFDLTDLVKLKNEMVAAHPDKGGEHEAFLAAYSKYEAAKKAAEGSLTF